MAPTPDPEPEADPEPDTAGERHHAEPEMASRCELVSHRRSTSTAILI